MGRIARGLALAQGLYWGVTGVWPILHPRSFEAVIGPRRERWVAKSMGAVVAAVGGTLLVAGARRRVTPGVMLLGATSALAVGGSAGWYAARGRLRRVYLADAAIEAALAAAWLGAGRAIGEAPGRAAAAGGALEALVRGERTGTRRMPFEAGEAVPEI